MSIGIHCDCYLTNLADSLDNTFEKLERCNCAQIFTHGPRTKSRVGWMRDPALLDRVKRTCQDRNIYVHQTYCTSWKPEGLQHMQDQFDAAEEIQAQGVVLHLGKISPQAHMDVIKRLNLHDNIAILEMRALRPDRWSYQSPDEINELCEAARDAGFGPDKVGICLDTAHINAARIKLTTRANARAFIDQLRYPEYITLLHLNGNLYDPNVRAGDAHCTPLDPADHVFRGVEIADSGAAELVSWFIGRDRDVILEQDWSPELRRFYVDLTEHV